MNGLGGREVEVTYGLSGHYEQRNTYQLWREGDASDCCDQETLRQFHGNNATLAPYQGRGFTAATTLSYCWSSTTVVHPDGDATTSTAVYGSPNVIRHSRAGILWICLNAVNKQMKTQYTIKTH